MAFFGARVEVVAPISDVPTHWNKDQKGTVNENMLTGSNSIQCSNPRETFQLQSRSSQHRAPHLSHGFQAVVQFEAETEGGFHSLMKGNGL